MNLAYRMRPLSLDTFVGQEHLVGEGKIIRQMIESDQLFSMIFWGPPGTGKTTLANIIAKATNSEFYMLSAVTTGKEDLMKIVKLAKNTTLFSQRTILFIDEIHRWNKAQQDVLLPHVESGLITLIGATTENPSFEVNNALLSRSRVFVLKDLASSDLSRLIERALTDKENGLGKEKRKITDDARDLLIRLSGGDARIVLNALEIAVQLRPDKKIGKELIAEVFQNRSQSLYDKKADEHYNTISAFIKSMRASNIDASLHYLARMIEGGEDPKFIARRMVIFASEDIGMAQPTALVVANEVFKTCETIGYPECAINLAHGVVYLASAKKDRSAYEAYGKALDDVRKFPNEPIPLKILNAPTNLMKDLGYGKGYEKYTTEDLLPEKLKGRKYYKGK
jgi:putative ATPase